MSLTEEMKILAQSAKDAARQMPRLNTSEKNRCLNAMADALESNRNAIGEANARDMETAQSMELSEAMMDGSSGIPIGKGSQMCFFHQVFFVILWLSGGRVSSQLEQGLDTSKHDRKDLGPILSSRD